MTKTEALSVIREAVFKVIPEVQGRCDSHGYHHPNCFGCKITERLIRLADVLLAMQKAEVAIIAEPYCLDGGEGFARLSYDNDKVCKYNLRQDNLESQIPETLEFLARLLVDK